MDDVGRSMFLAKPFEIDVFVRMAGELIRGDGIQNGSTTQPSTR
jgi:hypothetical protein